MENICPLCQRRVSNWMIFEGKAQFYDKIVVHKACAQDYKLRYGEDYVPQKTP